MQETTTGVLEATASASGHPVFKAWPRYDSASAGLRNYWYPVMFSRDLGKKPRPAKLCGEELFLIRYEGRAYALQDRCPHRGVPLSPGRCEFAGTISCVYHGWTYDVRDGNLVAALTDGPASPIVGKRNVQVRTYPVEERAGIVFVYIGDGTPPPVEADIPEEILAPRTKVVGWFRRRKGNWRFACENGFDEGHANYLHRRVVWTWFRVMPGWREAHIEREGDWLVRVGDRPVWQSDYPGLGSWPPKPHFWQTVSRGRIRGSVRLPGWVRIERPGWNAYEVFMGIDEGHYLSFMFLTKRTSPIGGFIFWLWYWLYRRWAYMGQFNSQDQWMIESMRIPPERLYRPDQSITTWRRLVNEEARRADVTVSDEATEVPAAVSETFTSLRGEGAALR